MGEVAGIDPADYETVAAFKHAVYDEAGAGTWLDDAKLEVVWRDEHDRHIPNYLQPLLQTDET